MDVKYEYICMNDYNGNNTEFFDNKKDAIKYAINNKEIVAIMKVCYGENYNEEIIWERDD